MRIALLGTRGIPANYGGFETFAEEVSKEWVEAGHEVTVYGRRKFFTRKNRSGEYLGIKYINTPTIFHKYTETPVHSLTSFLDISAKNYDVVLLCNAANSPFAFLANFKGLPLAINVDGIERRRSKWNALGRAWYRLGEKSSVKFADQIVSDADIIANYYKDNYDLDTTVIRYGANVHKREAGEVLSKFNIQPDNYILYVSRLEPENNALGVIRAYEQLNTDVPLVIVGSAPYAHEYIAQLKKEAGPQVIFTGFQFGEAYYELRSNCKCYIQATEVGGTHPALVEGMAYGNAIIANDVPEHHEVLQNCGEYYDTNNFDHLAIILESFLENDDLISKYRRMAEDYAKENYSWKKVAQDYIDLFENLIKK